MKLRLLFVVLLHGRNTHTHTHRCQDLLFCNDYVQSLLKFSSFVCAHVCMSVCFCMFMFCVGACVCANVCLCMLEEEVC